MALNTSLLSFWKVVQMTSLKIEKFFGSKKLVVSKMDITLQKVAMEDLF